MESQLASLRTSVELLQPAVPKLMGMLGYQIGELAPSDGVRTTAKWLAMLENAATKLSEKLSAGS